MYRIVLCCKTVGHLLIAVLCVDHLHWAVRPLPVLSSSPATQSLLPPPPRPGLLPVFTAACFLPLPFFFLGRWLPFSGPVGGRTGSC
jgi:hypothetical protein